MANTVYSNQVLESRLNDLLNTKLDVKGLMNIDYSLAEAAGTIKRINKYTYSGTVEELAKGNKNTVRGAISYETENYEVKVAQQVFDYYDEEAMADPNVIDMGMNGASVVMVNDMNTKYFDELAKANLEEDYSSAVSYDDFVDAIGKLNLEDESELFILIGNDMKTAIRKDDDFKSAKQGEIIYSGQIGAIGGIPVIVSKKVPTGEAFIASKQAITLFTKKDSEVETARDAEARKNTLVLRKVNLVALTDATKVCRLAAAATTASTITTKTAGAKTVAGAATTGATVSVYINGVLDGTATAASSAYSYTAKDNLASDDVIKVVARKSGMVSSTATATVS